MVDVGDKSDSHRRAKASGVLVVSEAQMQALSAGQVSKGDWQSVARVGGIMAAKRCGEWIPLCHPIAVDAVDVDIALDQATRRVRITCSVSANAKTGVEMEALCGVSAALLCVYDMIKGLDKGAHIARVALDEKSGGRSGDWVAPG
jgi:cyclic pyranopterin phosphate synthase